MIIKLDLDLDLVNMINQQHEIILSQNHIIQKLINDKLYVTVNSENVGKA